MYKIYIINYTLYNTYRFFWLFDLSYAVRNKVSLLPTSAHARLKC